MKYSPNNKIRIMKTINNFLIAIIFFGTGFVYAQEGEQLFKTRCNTCHQIEKNSTGPMLKGAKQKWEDAGEGAMLYDWVKNSSTLIASGKSARAKEVAGFSATAMPAQDVTNEQIDAILTYVDTYAPPALADTTKNAKGGLQPETKATSEDYKSRLSIFNWLLVLTAVLVVIIIVLSGSIIMFVKSDYFKQKVAEKSNLGNVLTVILTTGLFLTSFNASALDFVRAGEGEKDGPWLLVETMDLYGLLVINIILMVVVLYLRHLFNQMVAMTKKPEELAKAAAENQPIAKINQILTDAVPIEEEYKILMDHEYDGIQELDNNLPPWWVWGFVATIVFAFAYIINYHILGISDLQIKAYDKEMVQAKKDRDKYLKEMAMTVDETNVTQLEDKAAISAGKAIFDQNCTACHKAKGEGDIGPNLTDKAWIYGYDIKEVFTSIKKGRPNGMPEHESKLNPVQLQQVASFVLSLPETAGKEPQGTMIEK